MSTATIHLTRDSVCMSDDVEAPHDRKIETDAGLDLEGVARRIAAIRYLPMPSDAWGWTITVGDVVVAVRPRRFFGQRVQVLKGQPSSVKASDLRYLEAIYVRPGSHWRSHE